MSVDQLHAGRKHWFLQLAVSTRFFCHGDSQFDPATTAISGQNSIFKCGFNFILLN